MYNMYFNPISFSLSLTYSISEYKQQFHLELLTSWKVVTESLSANFSGKSQTADTILLKKLNLWKNDKEKKVNIILQLLFSDFSEEFEM